MSLMERHSGIALWRQTANQIRMAIGTGEFDGRETLPGEIVLAKRFDVNRHTVRNAIAALSARACCGSNRAAAPSSNGATGCVIRWGGRTRFSEGLARQTRQRGGRLKTHGIEAATKPVAEALQLDMNAPVLRLETLATADGIPVSGSTNWFDATRFPDFAETFRQLRSVTTTLKLFGIDDYVRISTRIPARRCLPNSSYRPAPSCW